MIFFAFHPSASFSQRIIIFHKRREKNYMKEMWKKKERNATTTTKQTENNQVCQVWVLCVIRALYTNNINFYWHCLMMIEYPWRYRFTLNGFVIEIYGLAQFFFFIFFLFFLFFRYSFWFNFYSVRCFFACLRQSIGIRWKWHPKQYWWPIKSIHIHKNLIQK